MSYILLCLQLRLATVTMLVLSICPAIRFNISVRSILRLIFTLFFDLVAAGQVRVLHVPSRYQFADIFTKGLPSSLFEEFRSSLSIMHGFESHFF
ncbi:hypothetical protein Tco_1242322 [Tanacetum coccineum]